MESGDWPDERAGDARGDPPERSPRPPSDPAPALTAAVAGLPPQGLESIGLRRAAVVAEEGDQVPMDRAGGIVAPPPVDRLVRAARQPGHELLHLPGIAGRIERGRRDEGRQRLLVAASGEEPAAVAGVGAGIEGEQSRGQGQVGPRAGVARPGVRVPQQPMGAPVDRAGGEGARRGTRGPPSRAPRATRNRWPPAPGGRRRRAARPRRRACARRRSPALRRTPVLPPGPARRRPGGGRPGRTALPPPASTPPGRPAPGRRPAPSPDRPGGPTAAGASRIARAPKPRRRRVGGRAR